MKERSTWSKALKNIEMFSRELNLSSVDWEPDGKPGEHMFPVRFMRDGRSVRVDMPGVACKGTITRLLINGDSWMWEYALDEVRRELDPKNPLLADIRKIRSVLRCQEERDALDRIQASLGIEESDDD